MSTVTNGRPVPLTAATSTTRAWSVHEASELYEVGALGQWLYLGQRRRSRAGASDEGAGTSDRPEGARRSTPAPRHQPPGADSLHRHPQAPPRRHSHRLPHRHRTASVPGRLQLRLPDQGQSAASGRRRSPQVRQAIQLRPRGRLEARAPGRRRARRQHDADHLQRLQGRRVHRDGDARASRSAATSSRSSRNTPSSD